MYNNIIHDVEAPGISVHGGFNILYAYNTLYRTGKGTSTISIRAGIHSCDGQCFNTCLLGRYHSCWLWVLVVVCAAPWCGVGVGERVVGSLASGPALMHIDRRVIGYTPCDDLLQSTLCRRWH